MYEDNLFYKGSFKCAGIFSKTDRNHPQKQEKGMAKLKGKPSIEVSFVREFNPYCRCIISIYHTGTIFISLFFGGFLRLAEGASC